jgi:Tfp pilus assembly protein PilV
MTNVNRALTAEDGFSIIELMVAIVILIIGVLGTVSLVVGANSATGSNRAREAATNLTREIIEDVRAVPYGQIDPTNTAAAIATLTGGTAQANGTVTYTRRNVSFTSTPTLCYVDDAKDGYGSHAGATFCNADTGTTDSFAQDYKRFTVVTRWTAQGRSGTARQSAVINDPGSSFAPRITDLRMTGPTACTGNPACTQIDTGVSSTATFSVTTSVPAATVTWFVNDQQMGTATGSGTSWTFSWSLGITPTGTYTVSAQANAGKDGPARDILVPIKTFIIGPPTNPFGGINQLWSGVDELNWTPVNGTVLGYEVERLVGGVWSSPIACYDVTGTTSSLRPTGSYCFDKLGSGATQYRIWTVYSKNNTATRSLTSANVTISSTNLRPCPPPSLTGNSNGIETWTRPTTSVAGSCDATRLSFYRVYKYVSNSGAAPPNSVVTTGARAFLTSGPNVLTWTDTSNTNKTFYWVTSVDTTNAESTLVGPVK